MEFIRSHPYFFANLPLLVMLLIFIKFSRPLIYSRLILLSGLLCAPGSITALIHNQTYWNPVRLFGGFFGIEDIMFTFIIGSLTWLVAAFPLRKRMIMEIHVLSWFKRSVFCGVLFFSGSALIWLTGIKGLENTLISGILALLVLLVIYRRVWYMALFSVLIFVPVYYFIVRIQFLLWPEYLLQWNQTAELGKFFLDLPAGELLFAVLFSSTWVFYVMFVFRVRLLNSPSVIVKPITGLNQGMDNNKMVDL